jgi:hypothetical protein
LAFSFPISSAVVVAHFYLAGDERYYALGIEAIRSVLQQTDFDVWVGCDAPERLSALASSRLHCRKLPQEPPAFSGQMFLRKLDSLRCCLSAFPCGRYILALDADTVLCRRLSEQNISDALQGRALGMVAQGIKPGSGTSQEDLWENYAKGFLRLLGPGTHPRREDFYYYNSGVVVAQKEELLSFLSWAGPLLRETGSGHDLGSMFVGDQHYFQIWANHFHPETTLRLPWSWNYCEHWDEGFDRNQTLIHHFSNYCLGPRPETRARMRRERYRTFPGGLFSKTLLRARELAADAGMRKHGRQAAIAP